MLADADCEALSDAADSLVLLDSDPLAALSDTESRADALTLVELLALSETDVSSDWLAEADVLLAMLSDLLPHSFGPSNGSNQYLGKAD